MSDEVFSLLQVGFLSGFSVAGLYTALTFPWKSYHLPSFGDCSLKSWQITYHGEGHEGYDSTEVLRLFALTTIGTSSIWSLTFLPQGFSKFIKTLAIGEAILSPTLLFAYPDSSRYFVQHNSMTGMTLGLGTLATVMVTWHLDGNPLVDTVSMLGVMGVSKYIFTWGFSITGAVLVVIANEQVLQLGSKPANRNPLLTVAHACGIIAPVGLVLMACFPLYRIDSTHPFGPQILLSPNPLHSITARTFGMAVIPYQFIVTYMCVPECSVGITLLRVVLAIGGVASGAEFASLSATGNTWSFPTLGLETLSIVLYALWCMSFSQGIHTMWVPEQPALDVNRTAAQITLAADKPDVEKMVDSQPLDPITCDTPVVAKEVEVEVLA